MMAQGGCAGESGCTLADGWHASPTFGGQVALHDVTTAYLCLQQLPPRSWWRLRSLSAQWRRLLDGGHRRAAPANSWCLLHALIDTFGPLDSANKEVDYAGLVYAAVHRGCADPLRHLLSPLSKPNFARGPFARGVAREALVQAAVSGDAPICAVVLRAYGPSHPRDHKRLSGEAGTASLGEDALCGATACRSMAVVASMPPMAGAPRPVTSGLAVSASRLRDTDVLLAKREAEEWDAASPGCVSPECRAAVTAVLSSALTEVAD
mmetsp:Transcript_15512/g.27774  ORF Transcript_15512/g.27774 Transcript_15512/m.27774 type:complete len:265 (-) Transcript_15512:157-951(-)